MNNTAKIIDITEARREEIAGRYKEIKELQSALAKEERELKNILQSWVPENETATAGKYTVVHTCTYTEGLDQDALKIDHPEYWTEYKKITPRRTVKIL